MVLLSTFNCNLFSTLLGANRDKHFYTTRVITAIIIYVVFKDMESQEKDTATSVSENTHKKRDQWFLFCHLLGIVVARSILFYGLNTFIPLYWISILKESPVMGNAALTILFTVGMAITSSNYVSIHLRSKHSMGYGSIDSY